MAAITETDKPSVVILVGPTGAGKSRLVIELAERFGGEIISADSMQVYRYMDIGTAKPTEEEQRKVPHHLIDVVNPDELFHADTYRLMGRKKIEELSRSGKRVWVAGGTGLYVKTLTEGIFPAPKIPTRVREGLKAEAAEKGGDALHRRLTNVDPETASRLHPHDLFRILRALEVFETTGTPISFFREQHRFQDRPFRTLKIGLEMERQRLYKRIDERVDRMVERGLLREVEGLIEKGYGSGLRSMQSLGYKQMVQFLNGEIGWDEAIRQMKRDTRRYAKRQLTWFKADPGVFWRYEDTGRRQILEEVESFLKGGANVDDQGAGQCAGSVSQPDPEGTKPRDGGNDRWPQGGRSGDRF
jgi:tRNA dimethylallyltransferase